MDKSKLYRIAYKSYVNVIWRSNLFGAYTLNLVSLGLSIGMLVNNFNIFYLLLSLVMIFTTLYTYAKNKEVIKNDGDE